MRVTLHFPAQNPVFSLVTTQGCPPKPARDIASTVTRPLPKTPRKRSPEPAAPRSRRRVTDEIWPVPAPARSPSARQPRTTGHAIVADWYFAPAPSLWPGTGPACAARPAGTSPDLWRGAREPADSASPRDTVCGKSAAFSPLGDPVKTTFHIRYIADCELPSADASSTVTSKGAARYLPAARNYTTATAIKPCWISTPPRAGSRSNRRQRPRGCEQC